MILEFSGDVFEWRGPAPFLFVRVPEAESQSIKDVAAMVSYGWGVIPASVTIGATSVTTSLFPKDGSFLVPIKKVLQDAERIDVGQAVEINLEIAI